MRAWLFALLAALTVAVAAAGAPGRSARPPLLTFKVAAMNGQRHVLSRHAIDPYAYSLSPDREQLAYIPQTCNGCTQESTMVAAVRSDDEHVLAGPFQDLDWAPNGRVIALQGSTGSEFGLFFVRADGRGLRHVANTQGVVWSPDSRSLAGRRPIDVYSVATGQDRHMSQGYGPAWSPDGASIAFAHNSTLEVASLGTGVVRDLTRDTRPVWSPNGRQIAFIRYVGDAYHLDLWVISSRGGKPRRLTRGLARFAPVVWSPNGKQIAYVRGRSLFVRALSGRQRLVARETSDVVPLAWSGDRILYFTLSR